MKRPGHRNLPLQLRTLVLAAMWVATPAAGQEAGEEGPPPRWEGEGELSFVSTSGNASTRTLGSGLEIHHRPGPWDLVSAAAFVRSRADGELNAESVTALFRAARALAPRLEGYGEIDYLKNRFAGIDHRVSPEAGVAFQLLPDAAAHTLRTLGAVGFVRETRLADEDRSFAAANLGLRYSWQMTPTAEITNEAGFTGNLDESGDWRIANRAALRAAITTVFSLRVSHTLEHLNQPVPGFESTDTRISVALVAGF